MDALKRFWQHFPAWFVFIMGFGILNYVVVRADPKLFGALDRDLFALTVVIPMAWFVLYFTLTIRREGRPRPLAAHAATWALAILVPLGTWFLATRGYVQRERLDSAQMVRTYELVQFWWLGVLVLHAWTTRGLQRALTFFGVCFLYGLLLENAGILLGFFSEHSYSVYLRLGEFRLPAPLATQFGWCIMFYVATHLGLGALDAAGLPAARRRARAAPRGRLRRPEQRDPGRVRAAGPAVLNGPNAGPDRRAYRRPVRPSGRSRGWFFVKPRV